MISMSWPSGRLTNCFDDVPASVGSLTRGCSVELGSGPVELKSGPVVLRSGPVELASVEI